MMDERNAVARTIEQQIAEALEPGMTPEQIAVLVAQRLSLVKEIGDQVRLLDTIAYKKLAAPLPTFDKNGIPHITIAQVINRVNSVIGPSAWSFRLLPGTNSRPNPWYDFDSGTVNASVEVTVHWPSGRVTVHHETGGTIPNRYRADRKGILFDALGRPEIMELSNDYKAAISDALKRCFWHIGVGMFLRKGGERVMDEPELSAPIDDRANEVRRASAQKGDAPSPARPAQPQQQQPPKGAQGGQQTAPAGKAVQREPTPITAELATLYADVELLMMEAQRQGVKRFAMLPRNATEAAIRAQIAGMERALKVTAEQLRENLPDDALAKPVPASALPAQPQEEAHGSTTAA